MKSVLMALMLMAVPAVAQEACPAAPPLRAGSGATDVPALTPGQGVTLSLKPAPQVHYSAAARRADDAKAFGGVAGFDNTNAGTWRISLGGPAWIAVVQNGVEVRSATHSHGDSCLVKMVDFPLQPGKVLIEISGTSDNSVRLMAAPVP